MTELEKRARWMVANGMRPQHPWSPQDVGKKAKDYVCLICPWDSPFKALAWAHPTLIEEDPYEV